MGKNSFKKRKKSIILQGFLFTKWNSKYPAKVDCLVKGRGTFIHEKPQNHDFTYLDTFQAC